ncbi:hypothetical protein CAMP5118_02485 [Campylobacter sp. LMG 7929]|uniref:hypothetical protein n=1 Tax=Campylobacter sp. LMG 7929 TaxID=2735749 RepID=UPI00301DE419|nr:hypothetical protein [Campylobacter sp. LMG 7929]
MIRAYANTISNILSNEKSIKKDTLFKRMNIKESEFNEALNFLLDHDFVKLEAISDGLFETIIVHDVQIIKRKVNMSENQEKIVKPQPQHRTTTPIIPKYYRGN